MDRVEPLRLRRSPTVHGRRLLIGGLLLAAAAWGPLLAYGVLGPTAGNPVSLSLFAALTTPLAIAATMLGAVCCAIDRACAGRR